MEIEFKRTKLEHCVITFETQVTIELYSSPFSMCMRQSNNENDTIILYCVICEWASSSLMELV